MPSNGSTNYIKSSAQEENRSNFHDKLTFPSYDANKHKSCPKAQKSAISVTFGLPKLKHWETQLSGATVTRVETCGKAMLTRFDNGLNIYSHNQLYGRWLITPYGKLPDTKRQLRLAIHIQDQSALLFSASDIEVLHDAEIQTHPFLSKLGPDILKSETTVRDVIERLTSKRFASRQLGAFLTDQSFVAGLGNYLRCEILFVAGLNPETTPTQLTDAQLDTLAHAILELPRQSYQTAGITNDPEHAKALMQQGRSFEDARFRVFRREGLPCYRCNTAIQTTSKGGQKCYYCPSCQPITLR